MRLVENFAVALRRLRVRPVRSFLLLQGTVWGVAVAIFPTSTIEGTKAAVLERGSAFGADRITIALDPTGVDPKPLDPTDVEAIRTALAAAGVPALAATGVALRTDVAHTVPAPVATDRGPVVPAVPAAVLFGPPDAFAARSLSLSSG